MAVGMAYSGWRQWRLEQLKLYHGFGYHGFGPPPAWYHVLRAFRVHDRALRGGLQLAGLATLFYGTHALTAVLRGRRRFWADGLAGGAAVGMVQARECAAPAALLLLLLLTWSAGRGARCAAALLASSPSLACSAPPPRSGHGTEKHTVAGRPAPVWKGAPLCSARPDDREWAVMAVEGPPGRS